MNQLINSSRGLVISRLAVVLASALSAPLAAQTLPPPPVSPAPVVRLEYDAQGNFKKLIQAPGAGDLSTSHSYDRLHRRTLTTDARSKNTTLGYNGQDALTQVTDPRSLVTQYPRNGFGEATGLVSPDTGSAGMTYDSAGNLKTRQDSRGVLATYSHDAMNRMTSVVYASGGSNQSFVWNYDQVGAGFSFGVGRLTSTQFPGGSEAYAYDAQGRITRTSQSITTTSGTVTKAVSYGYDAGGKLVSITYPSGRVLSIPHSGGLPVGMSLTAGGNTLALISGLTFEPSPGGAGPATSWAWNLSTGSGLAHTRVFDVYGRMVRYPLGGAVRDLTYDAADRISSYTHLDATSGTATTATQALNQGFGYDELGRLTGITTSQGSWAIGYDDNGNRTGVTFTASNGAVSARSYTVAGNSNRLLALSNPARSMSHDAAGNTQSDAQGFIGYTATHDLAGRIVQMESSANGTNVQTTQYWYNNAGLRILKLPTAASSCSGNPRTCTTQTTPAPTIYVYSPEGQLLGEYDGKTGAVRREYIWLGSMPIAFVDGTTSQNNVYYVQTDHIDTPRVVLDRQGRQRWSWVAEPFGNSAPVQNPLNLGAVTFNLRMPGQYWDRESGLSYNWWRSYDAGLGRYTTPDPLGLDGGDATMYGYVSGNPLSYFDPYGLFGMDDVWAGVSWATGGWTPAQGTVDAWAGFGDGVSLGLTRRFRKAVGTDGAVNRCSSLYRGGDFAGSVVAPLGRFAYIARVGRIGTGGVRNLAEAAAVTAERNAVKRYFRGPFANLFWDYKDAAWAAQNFARRGAEQFAKSAGKSNPGFNGLAGFGFLNAAHNQFEAEEDCTCERQPRN
jgi:RHS repeat-associated protein